MITEDQMRQLAKLGVHINVSLEDSLLRVMAYFVEIVIPLKLHENTIRKLANHGILQGFLGTPNNLTENHEYGHMCQYAIDNGAKYVLLNPLTSMGGGVRSKMRLAVSIGKMIEIKHITVRYVNRVELTYVRFPNGHGLPLTGCEAGNIFYVFLDGNVAICPYLFFAASTPQSQHKPSDSIVGNLFTDNNIATLLDLHNPVSCAMGNNQSCATCDIKKICDKGCPAAVISSGGRLGDLGIEICPKTTNQSE